MWFSIWIPKALPPLEGHGCQSGQVGGSVMLWWMPSSEMSLCAVSHGYRLRRWQGMVSLKWGPSHPPCLNYELLDCINAKVTKVTVPELQIQCLWYGNVCSIHFILSKCIPIQIPKSPIDGGSHNQFAHLVESQCCSYDFNLDPMMYSQEEDWEEVVSKLGNI